MAVKHALKVYPDGLQMMQLVRQLESADWLQVPVAKDLVKGDIMALAKEKKVRMGSSKKWTLTEEKAR